MARGELTTQQIVMLVVLLASFAVLIFFFARLGLQETSDKQICQNSVVLKSKSLVGGDLDCKTQYLCISDGSECSNFKADVIEEVDIKNKGEVFDVLAEEMADCWWQFGEGKIEYADQTPGINDNQCAICSVVKFEGVSSFTYSELYNHLLNEKEPGQSYLSYLYGVNDVISFKKDPSDNWKIDIGSESVYTNERYFIITGSKGTKGISDKFIPVYLVRSDEAQSRTDCNTFDLTKA